MPRSNFNEELIQQCKHRYRLLEVELNDAARSGTISSADYAKRLEFLQQIGQKISSLEIVATASKIKISGTNGFDLPLVEECSREEQNIIREALSNSKNLMDRLNADAEKLRECIRDAISEDGNWIKVAFRLSWIRRRMSWVEHQLGATRSLRGTLELLIQKIAPQNRGPESQADLVEAFREFETTTSRIAALKTKLKSEIAKNHDQEEWLRRYEANRRRLSTPVAPPVPAELRLAKQDISARFLNGAANAHERLVIARRLADSLTGVTQDKTSTKKVVKPQSLSVKPKAGAQGKGGSR